MIPEAVVAMLAVARIGAIHSVVFGGFSADSLASRIDDAEAKLVITADGGYRKGKVFPLKPTVDEALAKAEDGTVEQRAGRQARRERRRLGRRPRPLVARRPSRTASTPSTRRRPSRPSIRCSSSTRRAPPASPRASCTPAAATSPRRRSRTRTSSTCTPRPTCTGARPTSAGSPATRYVVYGPLANGATQVLYEGTPDTPHPGRWWEIVEKYKVSILYTAPTAIRSFMKLGRQIPHEFNLRSLRLLGSVGEPINPEAWIWYRHVIGGGSIPVVDTWWQTETGAIMISALPGITDLKPGRAQVPIPGISIDILDDDGTPVEGEGGGLLVVTEPWPSMLRGIWGDPERFKETYWEKFGDKYFAGDGARRDEDGDIWLLGRVDDVMNVSGHRLSTAEIESSLVAHPWTAEAAVVGASDETTGQAVVAFVILKASQVEHVTDRGGRRRGAAHATSPRRSARSPGRARCSSSTSCRRRARARSCAACCATSPRAARSATRRRSPTRR